MTKQPNKHPVSEVVAPVRHRVAGRALVGLCIVALLGICVFGYKKESSGTSRLSNPTTMEMEFGGRLSDAAIERTRHGVRYDSAYVKIPYPGGDVPADTGVCTDVIVRSFRGVGIDLQKEVHEDMQANFSLYPQTWGLKGPDTNIDHRRVPNLMTFFERRGAALPVTRDKNDYFPGDVVAWKFGTGGMHIGLVVDRKTLAGRPMIVHNSGAGPKAEDCLFRWKITGHYRYPHRLTS